MEEFVRGTGPSANYAAVRDVQIILKKEECASGVGLRSSDAAM
jgi:hypothetical protein